MVTCDNTVNPETADCSYSYDVGTSFSSTVSKSMSISATIGAEISATFEGLFSAGASASRTTSFDWSTSYDFSKTVDKTITVDTTVDSGRGIYSSGSRIIFIQKARHWLSSKLLDIVEEVHLKRTCSESSNRPCPDQM